MCLFLYGGTTTLICKYILIDTTHFYSKHFIHTKTKNKIYKKNIEHFLTRYILDLNRGKVKVKILFKGTILKQNKV